MSNDDDDFAGTFSTIKLAANPILSTNLPTDLKIADFWAYAPTHQYLYAPCSTLWVAISIDNVLPPQPALHKNGVPRKQAGKIVTMKASKWLDQNKRIDQMTWVPGEPTLIEGRLADKGGWKLPHERTLLQSISTGTNQTRRRKVGKALGRSPASRLSR